MQDLMGFYDEIIKKYNPKNEVLTQEIYKELRCGIMAGDKESLNRLELLTFYFLGEELKKDYIKNDYPSDQFEIDLLENYIIAQRSAQNYAKNYPYKSTYCTVFSHSAKDHLQSIRKKEKKTNAHLNYDWVPDVDIIADESSLTFVTDANVADFKERMKKRIAKLKISNNSKKVISIYLDHLEDKLIQEEIAKLVGISRGRAGQIIEEHIPKLKAEAIKYIK